jgi:hypothetical protein
MKAVDEDGPDLSSWSGLDLREPPTYPAFELRSTGSFANVTLVAVFKLVAKLRVEDLPCQIETPIDDAVLACTAIPCAL